MHSRGLAATTAADPGLVGLVPKPIEPVTSATLSSSDIAATSSLVRSPGLWLASIQRQVGASARCGTAPAAAMARAVATSARVLRWYISLLLRVGPSAASYPPSAQFAPAGAPGGAAEPGGPPK